MMRPRIIFRAREKKENVKKSSFPAVALQALCQ
jgi:hypothetical protein